MCAPSHKNRSPSWKEHLGKIRALFSQFGAEAARFLKILSEKPRESSRGFESSAPSQLKDGVITFDLFREKIKSPEVGAVLFAVSRSSSGHGRVGPELFRLRQVRHYFQTLGLDVWAARMHQDLHVFQCMYKLCTVKQSQELWV